MSGSGGGSGGGATGVTAYPAYMQTKHSTWLDQVANYMITAQTLQPYAIMSPFDPSAEINDIAVKTSSNIDSANAMVSAAAAGGGTAFEKLVTDQVNFRSWVAGYVLSTLWEGFVDTIKTKLDATILDNAHITTSTNDYSTILQDEIDANVVAKFEAGMRDANAVMTSAFVIGKALIYSDKSKQVAKYTSDLKVSAEKLRNEAIVKNSLLMLQLDQDFSKIRFSFIQMAADLLNRAVKDFHAASTLRVDGMRINIVALKEHRDEQNRITIADANWDLDVFQYGSNVLAGISGGVRSTGEGQTQKNLGSQLGGALSGAAMGAEVGSMFGPGPGTAIGAGIGAIAGFFGSR